MKKTIMIGLLTLAGFSNYAQHDHSGHDNDQATAQSVGFADQNLATAYHQYIVLKNALVASDENGAKKSALELQKVLKQVKEASKASEHAEKISKASSIEDQRLAFSDLSNEVTALVKRNKITAGQVYLEFCPMANNNEGGYWLSNEKAVKNPYFGDKMLKCGTVKETIQ